MKINYIPLFISFWFSLFFLSLAVFNSLIPLEGLDLLTNILTVSLCILCSHEGSRMITIFLLEEL